MKAIHVGSLQLDGVTPRIAVPFRNGTPGDRIDEAKRLGMDIAELRIDLFSSKQVDGVLAEIDRFQSVPVLATIRASAEGGGWDGSDVARLTLYEAVIPRIDAVDVELSSASIASPVVKVAHEHGKCAIVSFHDFERTPSAAALDDIAERAKAVGANIVKVAATCRTPEDVHALAEYTLRHRDKGLVTIGMGDVGLLTRVFFPALGSLFTFAAFGDGTAAGQIPLDETETYLRTFYPRRRG